jgi:hypothetical protein
MPEAYLYLHAWPLTQGEALEGEYGSGTRGSRCWAQPLWVTGITNK